MVAGMTFPVKHPPVPRTYYATRLLEHGPLTSRQFREITGWPPRVVVETLWKLSDAGTFNRIPTPSGYLYELA